MVRVNSNMAWVRTLSASSSYYCVYYYLVVVVYKAFIDVNNELSECETNIA